VSSTGGYANPGDYADPAAGVVGGRRRSERVRALADKLGAISAKAATALKSASVMRPIVVCVSVLMIVFPVITFATYLWNGTLLISPPLLLTFLCGFVGLGLAKSENWH
jgi:hypothetical protein